MTTLHRDSKNLAFGICAVGVFGRFDHQNSGHLLLAEPGMVVEVQRGEICYLPSACVTHGNRGLGEGETRMSMVFYSAGGLFRWISQGHQLSQLCGGMGDTEHGYAFGHEAGKDRWKEGWDLYCTREELLGFKRGS